MPPAQIRIRFSAREEAILWSVKQAGFSHIPDRRRIDAFPPFPPYAVTRANRATVTGPMRNARRGRLYLPDKNQPKADGHDAEGVMATEKEENLVFGKRSGAADASAVWRRVHRAAFGRRDRGFGDRQLRHGGGDSDLHHNGVEQSRIRSKSQDSAIRENGGSNPLEWSSIHSPKTADRQLRRRGG